MNKKINLIMPVLFLLLLTGCNEQNSVSEKPNEQNSVVQEVAVEPTGYSYQTIYNDSTIPSVLYEDSFTSEESMTNLSLCEEYGEEFFTERAQRSKECVEEIFNHSYEVGYSAEESNLPEYIMGDCGLYFIDYQSQYDKWEKNEYVFMSRKCVLTALGLYDFYVQNKLITEAEYITDKSLIYKLPEEEVPARSTFEDRLQFMDLEKGTTHADETWINRGLLKLKIVECDEECLDAVAKALGISEVKVGEEYELILTNEFFAGSDFDEEEKRFTYGDVDDWDLVQMNLLREIKGEET